MNRSLAGLVALSMVAAACGGGTADSTTSSQGATTSQAATTTTAAPATTTTVVATTSTTAPPRAVFTAEDLPMAVLTDGDPWVVPIVGVDQLPLNLDVIWPAHIFPEERLVYEDAEFERGYFSAFVEADALVITGAHLFAEPAGADAALELLESSFSDTELAARITDSPPGSLTTVEPLASDLGDRSTAVRVSGPNFKVVGVIWIQGNLLQFVRVGMLAGDPVREAAAFVLAEALAARVAGG